MKTGFTVLLLLFSFPFFAQLEFAKDMIEVEGSASYRYDDRQNDFSNNNNQKRITQSFNINAGFGWHIRPGIVWGIRTNISSSNNKTRGIGENSSRSNGYGFEIFHRRYLKINNWQRIHFFSQFDLGAEINHQKADDTSRGSESINSNYRPIELRAGFGILVKITRRIALYKYLYGINYDYRIAKSENLNQGVVFNENKSINHSIYFESTQFLTQFSVVYFLNTNHNED